MTLFLWEMDFSFFLKMLTVSLACLPNFFSTTSPHSFSVEGLGRASCLVTHPESGVPLINHPPLVCPQQRDKLSLQVLESLLAMYLWASFTFPPGPSAEPRAHHVLRKCPTELCLLQPIMLCMSQVFIELWHRWCFLEDRSQ